MKKFISRTTIFILVPIVAYTGVFALVKFDFQNDLEEHEIIILGDSQTEFIKNDKIYNHSIHGSPYFVHYQFGKEFRHSLSGKKVYIACNYQNLSAMYQNRLVNDSLFPGWKNAMLNRMDEFRLLNRKHKEISTEPRTDFSFFTGKKLPKLIYNLYIKKDRKNSTRKMKDRAIVEADFRRHWEQPEYIFRDTIQREYLQKLITLLKNENCEVVLLKMPLLKLYSRAVPQEVKQELYKFAEHNKIRLLDLDDRLSISNNFDYFKDYGHLNRQGDSIINKYFVQEELEASGPRDEDI